MQNKSSAGIPVVKNEKLVGIVTETDLLNYLIRVLETGT
jgi:CBS domain-containing protein